MEFIETDLRKILQEAKHGLEVEKAKVSRVWWKGGIGFFETDFDWYRSHELEGYNS